LTAVLDARIAELLEEKVPKVLSPHRWRFQELVPRQRRASRTR